MNVMAQAHKATKAHFAKYQSTAKMFKYAEVFKDYLKDAHKEYKAMQNDKPESKAMMISRPHREVFSLIAPNRTAKVFATIEDKPMYVVEHWYKGKYQGMTTTGNFETAKRHAEQWQSLK